MTYEITFKASALIEAESPEEAKRILDAEMPDTYANGEHTVTFDHEYEVRRNDDEWECQCCHKHFPATYNFGMVESDLGFLCYKCIRELAAKGVKLIWED